MGPTQLFGLIDFCYVNVMLCPMQSSNKVYVFEDVKLRLVETCSASIILCSQSAEFVQYLMSSNECVLEPNLYKNISHAHMGISQNITMSL